MAWMHCRGCSAKYAVGLLRCPQCQALSELFAVPEEVVEAEQEADMPKISVGGGPSNALGQPAEPEPAATGPDEPAPQTEPETSDVTPAATDEACGDGESAEGSDTPDTSPPPKPAKKAAAKKAAAKQEPPPAK